VTLKKRLRSIGRHRGLQYALSVPERAVRSVAALTAGLAREVAEVALPIGVRRGRFYRNLVDVTLRFLLEEVGQVEGLQATDEQLGENFLLRRAAGNGIEIMGLLAFRASPVWVFAALADVCGFGRQMIPEVAEALKKEGLLKSAESFKTMEQLLQGLEGSAAQIASSVNTPPLDIASLRAEWRKLSAEVRRLPAPKLPSRRAVTGLWADLRMEADRQQRSVFAVSSLLAVAAVGELPERARILSRSAAVALTRSGAVLSGALLDHYRESLREMRRVGFVGYGVRQLAPYTRAALAAFSPGRTTLTSRYLDKL
jgi:hypothetical protein